MALFVVVVCLFLCYNCFARVKKNKFKGELKMNTDKIYAEQIANEYTPKQTSKVKALKKLDAKAKNPANIFTYTFGIISSLLLGTGMSLAMGVIGGGTTLMMALGIIIGLVGIAGICVNYPLYKKILANSKKKYANDIIKLANEIANEQ